MFLNRIQHFRGIFLLVGVITGCGGGDAGSEVSSNTEEKTSIAPIQTTELNAARVAEAAGITASIDSPSKAAEPEVAKPDSASTMGDAKLPFPDDDATKTLQEIQKLRIAALPTDIKEVKAARRERNERIVDMATKVLRLTMNDDALKPQFHQAVGQLLEARFQMALSGTKDDIGLLYEDVQALNERDPKSVAAAEGVYYVAKFAHTQAGLHGKSQPVWFETLSHWAREFADRFPEQAQRSVSLLFGAARSCELHSEATKDAEVAARLTTECRLCYTTLADKFATTEQGQEAIASLRRMALVGQQLSQFSGPTADGGFVSADEFPGKPTVIYFWESDSEEFISELLPELEKIRSLLPADRLRVIGVALDDDESTINSFMETHVVPGQQIFFPNTAQRSWNSPLIRFWGIAKTPTVWLIDSNGKVVSTTVVADDLANQIKKLAK